MEKVIPRRDLNKGEQKANRRAGLIPGVARNRPVAVLGIAISLFAASCTRSSKAAAADSAPLPIVAVARVTRKDLARRFEVAAEFRPYQEIKIYAKVPGYVKKIYVDIGDRVRTGQLLAVLEIPELTADLDHAKAAVRRSQDELHREQSELARAKYAHEVAHLESSRMEDVVKSRPGLVAQQEIDDAEGHDREAEAQVASAEAGLEAAQEQLQVDQASLVREQSLVDYSRIVAPFDGVVTDRYADTGAMVAAGTSSEKQALPVVELAQNNLLRLDIPVPESIVPRIHAGTPVTLKVPSLSKTFEGKVVRFADSIDTATRTMTTEIDVPNPKLELVPGMYAYASLTLNRRPDALAVPVLALIHSENQTKVFKVDDGGQIEAKPVTVGIQTPEEVEILSGLDVHDLVVVGQQAQLQPGEKVRPKEVAPIRLAADGAK